MTQYTPADIANHEHDHTNEAQRIIRLGAIVESSKSVTRPADTTAYAAKDAINTATSGAVALSLSAAARKNGGAGYIRKLLIKTNKIDITPRLRVHFYNASTITVHQDNAAFNSEWDDRAKHLGFIDLDALHIEGASAEFAQAQATDLAFPFVCATDDDDLYFQLETLDAFTPASGQIFLLTATIDQD
jgi:hypothetical protein